MLALDLLRGEMWQWWTIIVLIALGCFLVMQLMAAEVRRVKRYRRFVRRMMQPGGWPYDQTIDVRGSS